MSRKIVRLLLNCGAIFVSDCATNRANANAPKSPLVGSLLLPKSRQLFVMQAQDESFKPAGRQYSYYGEALNSGKGALWHGAFWAATGFISCAAANRMMNRRAMTCEWLSQKRCNSALC